MKAWVHFWLWAALAGRCENSYEVVPNSASLPAQRAGDVSERTAAISDPIVTIGDVRTLGGVFSRNVGEVVVVDTDLSDRLPPATVRTEPRSAVGVHYPDSANRIQIDSISGGKSQQEMERNPWENHAHESGKTIEITLDCGGIIAGSNVEPIAILNGRIMKKGDRVDDFIVNGVEANEVFLEHKGTIIAIPRGRRVVVAISQI